MTPTLGPWSYARSKGGKWYVYGADGKPIICPNVSGTNRSKREMEANSRLIAAAPDGYHLAKLILETNDVPEGPIRKAARTLLFKVEGHA